jgi:hypothetical protein
MAKRIAVHTLVLHRAGKRVSVKPGQVVDLTDAELEDIRKTSPDALAKIPAPAESNEVKLPPAEAPKAHGGKNQGKGKQEEKPAAAAAAETPAATDDEI